MAKKRYRPEEIIAKLREADVLLAQGNKVPEVAKAIGIHEITYSQIMPQSWAIHSRSMSQVIDIIGKTFHQQEVLPCSEVVKPISVRFNPGSMPPSASVSAGRS